MESRHRHGRRRKHAFPSQPLRHFHTSGTGYLTGHLEVHGAFPNQKPSDFLTTPASERGKEQYDILRSIVFPPTFSLSRPHEVTVTHDTHHSLVLSSTRCKFPSIRYNVQLARSLLFLASLHRYNTTHFAALASRRALNICTHFLSVTHLGFFCPPLPHYTYCV